MVQLKETFVSLPCLYGKSKYRNVSLSSWSWYAKCPNTKVIKKLPKVSLHPKQDISLHMLLCREETERKSQSFLSTLLEAAQILWWWVWYKNIQKAWHGVQFTDCRTQPRHWMLCSLGLNQMLAGTVQHNTAHPFFFLFSLSLLFMWEEQGFCPRPNSPCTNYE